MKKSTVIFIWGGITGIACSLHKAILVQQGISLSGWSYFSFLILFLGLFIGVKQVKDKVNGGYLTFGQGYTISLLMTSIVTIIGLISVIITLQIVPDLGDRLLNEMHLRFINSGMSQEMIDKFMSFYANSFTPGKIILGAIFGNIIFGALLGLIAAGINTKKKPIFDDANEISTNDIPQA